jgi:hypothetical protein
MQLYPAVVPISRQGYHPRQYCVFWL